ncbi:MAG: DUF115 domain-containing protein [Treponema sp.]|jgi:hypothetical protein|nr:DUF115 domain-containing protein [Treponema sp.]
MDRKFLFEQNLLSLSKNSPELCSRLSAASTDGNEYRFLPSRTGEIIPALTLPSGSARPLHSTMDPKREAERLIATAGEEGFFVFFGLGGGFAPEAALERKETKHVLVIDYGCNGAAELLCSKNYTGLFGDSRFKMLIDPPKGAIQDYITLKYRPVLQGGIRVFPLLPRTEGDKAFGGAHEEIKNAIDLCTRDYSVQAWFGKRWFSNILRNLSLAEQSRFSLPPARRAAITAAGPSLDSQIPLLKKERASVFLIATDTSLPALLNQGLEPDGVLSIDCQHISYHHFFSSLPRQTFLFLDLASPHTIAALGKKTVFFAGGHPLAQYIKRVWRPLPGLDTSGANVAYAAVSLAENLGATEITLYGADFSYPRGRTYARGAYIYPFFENRQTRFFSMETQHSGFLYRSPFLEKMVKADHSFSYRTESLKFYQAALEQKAASSPAHIRWGNPLSGQGGRRRNFPGREISAIWPGNANCSAAGFLEAYKKKLESLSSFDDSLEENRNVLTTILPSAAAFRRLSPSLDADELFRETRSWCVAALEKVIAANKRYL